MSVVDTVGWIAALSSAGLAVPQGTRIALTRSVAGVSVITWQTMFIAGLAWSAHGILNGNLQILVPNVLLAVTSGWVLLQLAVARRLPVTKTWSFPVLIAAAAFGADLMWGPVAYAVVIFIPGAVGQLSQLREILRAPDARGVSLAGLWLQLANQVLWFGYALPAGEVAVMCVSAPIGVLIAASVIALYRRRVQQSAVAVLV